MTAKQTTDETTELQKAIDRILNAMQNYEPHTDEYVKMVDQLDKLNKIKDMEKPDRVSKDVLVNVLGSLAGIVAIMSFEKTQIITSKALGFIMKIR